MSGESVVNKRKILLWSLLGLLPVLLMLAQECVHAYSSAVRDNLLKSRDALLDQQAQLERTDSALAGKIKDMQNQRATINMYLKDIDRSLRDLDIALQNQDYAQRRR